MKQSQAIGSSLDRSRNFSLVLCILLRWKNWNFTHGKRCHYWFWMRWLDGGPVHGAGANLHPLLITGEHPGGLLTTTSIVENYPGFPEGVDGTELMIRMQKQAERFGAETRFGARVTKVDLMRFPISTIWLARRGHRNEERSSSRRIAVHTAIWELKARSCSSARV